jgi:multimeric flavodoxin WrbA
MLTVSTSSEKEYQEVPMTNLVIYDAPDVLGGDLVDSLKRGVAEGAGYRFIDLASAEMHPCIGCFKCWLRTPGECVYRDEASRIVREIVNADRVLFLCPVTWGSYSPAVKTLLDRSICRVLPFFEIYKGETHHPARYEHSPETWLVGYGGELSEPEISLFEKLGGNLDDNLQKGGMRIGVINGGEGRDILDRFVSEEEGS